MKSIAGELKREENKRIVFIFCDFSVFFFSIILTIKISNKEKTGYLGLQSVVFV